MDRPARVFPRLLLLQTTKFRLRGMGQMHTLCGETYNVCLVCHCRMQKVPDNLIGKS